MEWTGGIQKCIGTTADQAHDNLVLREKVATHPDVVSLFNTYRLEDGAVVKLDRNTASNHVKACLNEMKKSKREVKRCNPQVEIRGKI